MSCVFCKIIAGEIPSFKVYEDDYTLAFLDINPVKPGHTLVVSKKHLANLEETDEETLCRVMSAVKKVGLSLKNNLGAASYNVTENNDPAAGQMVSHLHFHVIPRLEDDGLESWPQGKYGEGEAETVLNKIKII